MRPSPPFLALASLLMLAACRPGWVDPNGKNDVLYFFGDQFPMSRHLDQHIYIWGSVFHDNGPFFPGDTWTFDFKGTTLEVSGEGIESPAATLDSNGNYEVRFRCMAPSGVPTELRVWVRDWTGVRYADAIDVTCWEPESLEVRVDISTVGHPQPPLMVPLGGEFMLHAIPRATVWGEQGHDLKGTGIGFADAGPVSLVSDVPVAYLNSNEMTFRAERLGKDPVLAVESLQAVVPIEVIPDDAWTLQVEAKDWSSSIFFTGYVALADGDAGIGLRNACTFQLSYNAAINVFDWRDCSGNAPSPPDAGQICVNALGRNACATW